MFVMPFVCLAVGALIGISRLGAKIGRVVDMILSVAVVLLMFIIGVKIGVNDSLIKGLLNLGFNCAVIAASAVFFSVAFVMFVEKFIVSLEDIKEKIASEGSELSDEISIPEADKESKSPLIWGIPVAVVTGVLTGYFFFPENFIDAVEILFVTSLIFMYTGVGISFGLNKWVLAYVKTLGFKVLLIPLAIILGSLAGGLLPGLILNMNTLVSVCSALGMGYYSLPGAVLTQAIDVEAGTYGFLVNVMREFITITLLPLLVKLGYGAPIASAAAGGMDTMLIPVTKLIGLELGVVSIITGVILTVSVPVLFSIILPMYGY